MRNRYEVSPYRSRRLLSPQSTKVFMSQQESTSQSQTSSTTSSKYPVVYPTSPPLPPLFTSWDSFLSTSTRTGKSLSSIPRFMEFIHRHQNLAERWTTTMAEKAIQNLDTNQNLTSTSAMTSELNIKREMITNHVPNLLQGGSSTGPIMSIPAEGRKIRALAYYPSLVAPFQPVHFYSNSSEHFETHPDVLSWITQISSDTQNFLEIQKEVLHEAPRLPIVSETNDEEDINSYWTPLRTRKGNQWSCETGWSHIALMDNFQWIPKHIELFPETMDIIEQVLGTERRLGPRLIAIAKQSASSGIPPHWDYMNWMWTFHMGLGFATSSFMNNNQQDSYSKHHNITCENIDMDTVAGININGTNYPWKIGSPLVLDTTFVHSTYNDHPSKDIYMLLIDFWHPEMSVDEIDAMRYFWAANSGV